MMEATGNSESCERWRWRPASLDIFWLRDESLEDSANLPEPAVIAAEIAEDLEAALGQIRGILEDLGEK
jgi:type I restriction enzyme M protein